VAFHSGTWIPDLAAIDQGSVVIAIQLGAGSAAYARPFGKEGSFLKLLEKAEKAAGKRFGGVTLCAWSAGCDAPRAIFKHQEDSERVRRVILIDGVHASYRSEKPGPLESDLDSSSLDLLVAFARRAIRGEKRMLLMHSEIFPGTYASTTETADSLLRQLRLERKAVLKWGPMGTQQLSEAKAGQFNLLGYAGNSAPDHVDQLHSLLHYVTWKTESLKEDVDD
jgi:hypothetical protein